MFNIHLLSTYFVPVVLGIKRKSKNNACPQGLNILMGETANMSKHTREIQGRW